MRFIHNALRGLLVFSSACLAIAQTAQYHAPRASGGHPDISGIWQALNTANWNLEDHSAEQGPVWELGAIGVVLSGPRRSGGRQYTLLTRGP